MEKLYGMHKLVGLQLFWSRTPNFSSGTPTFCQMGVLNSCFQNPSESSGPSGNKSQVRYLQKRKTYLLGTITENLKRLSLQITKI